MHKIPKISVLMPVYNGERWLDVAIKSILSQTYSDFEFLILLEHGSNKKSREIVYSHTDKRIRVIENKERLGLAASLNVGIREARGQYIARMDADDISARKRFEKQVAYLERHPNIAICGTAIKGEGIVRSCRPSSPMAVRFFSFIEGVFAHSTVMWRRDWLLRKNFFYQEGIEGEDNELWMRVLDKYKGANIPEPLLMYRKSTESKSSMNREVLEKENDRTFELYWARNGLRYYAPDSFHRFQDEARRQKEWRLLELVHKTKEFKGKGQVVRELFFDLYMAETLQVSFLVRRYNKLFSDLYSKSKWERLQVFWYAVFRVTKRKIRLCLMKVRGRR